MDRNQKFPLPEYTEDTSVLRTEQLEVGVQAQVTGTTALPRTVNYYSSNHHFAL
jgi:hypothetical protein